MEVLKICPNFLSHCSKYVKNKILTVSGTNGKSTTSGLCAHMLEVANQTVIHNLKGANMLTGVANAFALEVRPFKRYDYAVIESDEAYLTKLYDFINSDYLIVTNLFRDQLDRYGELATTAGFIQNAIDKNKNLTLILNADDPLVTNFGQNRENVVYFGFENVEELCDYEKSSAPTEVFNCPCGKPLEYSKTFFAQEGHYYCSACGFKRPNCKYSADAKIYKDKIELNVKFNDVDYKFTAGLVGLYNAYNVLAAIAFGFENGLNQAEIQKAISTYKSIFGRTEKRLINGHNTLIQLIKNPTGASEVLKTVDLNSNILIAINDNYADGRDISWLWDSDFEQLKNAKKLVVTSGVRALDMATRLKYAGISQEKIVVEPDIKKAINIVTKEEENPQNVTILPSYTALLKINKMKFKEKI
jgi:UDP-N-acetylmuramyl tripeptide synthase